MRIGFDFRKHSYIYIHSLGMVSEDIVEENFSVFRQQGIRVLKFFVVGFVCRLYKEERSLSVE